MLANQIDWVNFDPKTDPNIAYAVRKLTNVKIKK